MLDEGNYKGINAQTSDDELSGIEKEMVQIRESEQQQQFSCSISFCCNRNISIKTVFVSHSFLYL
jgi:hypothetical protein